jgi:hypothetical protein
LPWQVFVNEVETDWGLKCLCYEIRDIDMQVEVERKKGLRFSSLEVIPSISLWKLIFALI